MFLQGALQATTFITAMVLLPASLASAVVTPIAGKLYDKFGTKVLVPAGFAIILVPLLILSYANTDTSIIKIIVLFVVIDIGISLTMSPSQITALNTLPKESYPHGVAILNTLQQLASAIGSSLFIGIMSASQLKALSNQVPVKAVATGFGTAAFVLSGFVFVGLLLSIALSYLNKKTSVVTTSI